MGSKISVIIPVYNVEKYLPRCVESVIGQTYKDLEIILVDDGSSDLSGTICDQYADKDARIVVIHKENGGVSSARNCGLRACTGDFITFVDSDDWIDQNMYKQLMSAIEATGADFSVCGSNSITVNADGSISKKERRIPQNASGFTCVGKNGIYGDIFAITATLWNKLFRRDVINTQLLDESLKYGEDCVFLLNVLDYADKAAIVPERLYNYYINREGNVVSASLSCNQIEYINNSIYIYDVLRDRGFPDVGVYRIYLAICEVVKKIPIKEMKKNEYKEYRDAIRKAIKHVGLTGKLAYFKSKRFSKGQKLRFAKYCMI